MFPSFITLLILDYFMYDNKALLIEGNHRLNAAILAGLKEVPVRVVRSKRDAPAKAISVRGFIKKHEHQHIPSDLKPSEIGIDVINNSKKTKSVFKVNFVLIFIVILLCLEIFYILYFMT